MQRWLCGALLATAALASVFPSAARADEEDDGSLVVIQQRKFPVGHELDVAFSFEPENAFSKGLGAELSYGYHFTDTLEWEVIHGGYLGQVPTGLQNQLTTEFAVAPTQFELLQYYASSSLVWSPLYGKLAANNGSVAHIEAFLDIGPALGRFTDSFRPGGEVGVGFRVFINRVLSVRFDARDALYFSGGATDVVFLSLGLGIMMGGHD